MAGSRNSEAAQPTEPSTEASATLDRRSEDGASSTRARVEIQQTLVQDSGSPTPLTTAAF